MDILGIPFSINYNVRDFKDITARYCVRENENKYNSGTSNTSSYYKYFISSQNSRKR
jgi:hypothetical protein